MADTAERVVSRIRGWSTRTRPKDQADVKTIPFIIGANTAVITTGVQACLPIFLKGRLVAVYIQEFDGLTGSLTMDVLKASAGYLDTTAPGGNPIKVPLVTSSTPVFTSIIGTGGTPIAITADRQYKDEVLSGWDVEWERGDYLMIDILTISTFKRLSVAFAFRRKA